MTDGLHVTADGSRAVPRPQPVGVLRAGVHPPLREAARVALPLLALYVAVCALAQPGPHPVRDEPDLLAAAARLLDGHLVPSGAVTTPRAYLWHGPGIVALLAPFVALGLPLTAMRFIEPLLMVAAALLFHRVLRVRLRPGPALAWTYAFGLYVPFFSVVPQVHKEPLAVLLVVAGILALTRALSGGRWPSVAAAGLALAALTMVRLEYGWVSVALLACGAAGWAAHRRSVRARRLVAIAAVAVAGCVPWLACTYHLTGKPLYWGTSSGLSLFWMSPTVPGETGQWHEPSQVSWDPALARYRPFFRELQTLDPVESDSRLRERALANIRARPGDYARNLAANAARLLFSAPMRPGLPPLGVAVYALFNSLLMAAAGWAAVILWRRRRAVPPETVPIALFAAIAIAAHLPPSASPRMLLPIVPALLWLVAHAAALWRDERAQAVRARRAARTS
jgi:hypothetical protein